MGPIINKSCILGRASQLQNGPQMFVKVTEGAVSHIDLISIVFDSYKQIGD
jgi:hypothetical protein